MIISAPGSGKTHQAQSNAWLVDGDLVAASMYKKLFDTFGPRFWTHKDYNVKDWRAMKRGLQNQHFINYPGTILLDVEGPPQWVKCGVLIPEEDHRRQIEYRNRNEHRGGGDVSWAEIQRARTGVAESCREYNVPIFTTFREAIEYVAGLTDHMRGDEMPPTNLMPHKRKPKGLKDWRFVGVYQGYKDSDPPTGGSTRVVWQSRYQDDAFLVFKLFDDDETKTYPEFPRTIKFWRTKELRADRLKWKSSQYEQEWPLDRIRDVAQLLIETAESIGIGEMFIGE